jgi:hypothetical protein
VARTAVIAGTASAVSGRVQRHQQEKWAGQEQEQYEQQVQAEQAAAYQQQMAAQQAPAGGGDDTVAQLQQLAQLKDQGILTEEEFAAKKKQILGI